MFVHRMVKDPEFAEPVAASVEGPSGARRKIVEGRIGPKRDRRAAKQERADAHADGYGPEVEQDEVSAVDSRPGAVAGVPEASDARHAREDEIKVIAQSLAFVGVGAGSKAAMPLGCDADAATSKEIEFILRQAYADEEEGRPEGFRRGEMLVGDVVQDMLRNETFRWVTVEAANGRGVETNGAILGVACFSLSSKESFRQKKRGTVEGCNATLRFLAVRHKYRGLCVGDRLLQKMKQLAAEAGAMQLLACVPSPRTSVKAWLSKRGFGAAAKMGFPTEDLPFEITVADAELVIMAAQLVPKKTEKTYDQMD